MKRRIFAVTAILFSSQLIAVTTAQAQTQQDSTQTLDQIIITANKISQKQSTTGKIVAVITREQLERNAARSLTQVLNEEAGIFVNGSQNAPGTNQTVYMRGAGAANTLILIDGVPALDPSGISQEFDLNHIAIEQIERVEILKGSQSTLYGSDAVAGVINIITKKSNSNKPIGISGSAAGGTYGTFKGNAAISGKTKHFGYNLQYSRLSSNGFSAAHDTTGKSNYDIDGFAQNVVGLNLTAAISEDWKLRLFGQYSNYDADIDDAPFIDDKNNTIKNKNFQAGLQSTYDFNKGNFVLNLNMNNTERKLDDPVNTVPTEPYDYDPYNAVYKGKSIFAEGYTNLSLHKNINLLAGMDFRANKADIESLYGNLGSDSLKATQFSVYSSVILKSLGGFSAEAGVRYTTHSEAGSAFTWSINPSYLINHELKIFANISTGFRAPSLYNIASEYGNKDLKPEKSTSYEGGLQFSNSANTISVRGSYFSRKIEDVIIFKSLFTPPYGQYANADEQNDHGFELELEYKPNEKMNISANYSFVDGEINSTSSATSKDTSFFNLYRRPKNTFNLHAGYEITKKLYAGLGFRNVGKRTDVYSDPISFETSKKELKSYYNLDLYVSFQVKPILKLFVDLRNITNQEYFDLYGYNSRKFNFMAGFAFHL